MFERYTETARRVIFFARYEAGQFGSPSIETEHLLLGILHEDFALVQRHLKAPGDLESLVRDIETQTPRRENAAVSGDLPVGTRCKRVLAYAAEQAERMNQPHIGPEHLLAGLLREKKSAVAKILIAHGLNRSELEQETAAKPETAEAPRSGDLRDLTAAAHNGELGPLVGREQELDRLIQILCRRTRNSAAVIGEPGVGKNTLVHGLAQRLAANSVPAALEQRRILEIDASSLSSLSDKSSDVSIGPDAIVYVQGLFDLAAKGSGILEPLRAVESLISAGVRCIGTGTPFGMRITWERAESLARRFEMVRVDEPAGEEATRMVAAAKQQFETFHGVTIADDAVTMAVTVSRWFLRHRHLPDRAIDLLDDAAARVQLRRETKPREVVQAEARIKQIVRKMENAIANREFDKARTFSEEERKERDELRRLREQFKAPHTGNVTAEDVIEAMADRAGVAVEHVRSFLEATQVDEAERIAKELAARLPPGAREWAERLAEYLAICSPAETQQLAQAILDAKRPS